MADRSEPGFNPLWGLLAWLVTVALAAGLATVASSDAEPLYAMLAKPVWAPPANAFAPAWTLLYLAMAIAAWLVWRERGFAGAAPALTLFLVQLAVNALWSWLFFAWREGLLAFVDIVLLAILVAAAMAAFWRLRPLAGALLLPYLVWVLFAAALNFEIWRLNPTLLG